MAEQKRKANNEATPNRIVVVRPSLSRLSNKAKTQMWSWMEALNHPKVTNVPADLELNELPQQYDVTMNMGIDISKANLVLYTSVLSLNANHSSVDKHFYNFLRFIRTHRVPLIRAELRSLSWPIFAHVFIEMLKGKDPEPAAEFIRKYAGIIGKVESVDEPVHEFTPECNNHEPPASDGLQNIRPPADINAPQSTAPPSSAAPSNGTTPNQVDIRPTASTKVKYRPSEEGKDDLDAMLTYDTDKERSFFQELVEALSMCEKLEQLNAFAIVRKFRGGKYYMVLSQRTINAMKHYLGTSGHLTIIHVLQIWLAIDIREAMIVHDSDSEEFDPNDPAADETDDPATLEPNEEASTEYIDRRYRAMCTDIRDSLTKMESQIKTINRINPAQGFFDRRDLIDDRGGFGESSGLAGAPAAGGAAAAPPSVPNQPPKRAIDASEMSCYVRARQVCDALDKQKRPIRVFHLHNTGHQLSSVDMDATECHLALGTDESTVLLWSLSRSKMRGIKPYAPVSYRMCDWSLANVCASSSSESESESDDDDDNGDAEENENKWVPPPTLFAKPKREPADPKPSKQKQAADYLARRCIMNTFSDQGFLPLYGHSRGVTSVCFSKYNPVLFSTSKDGTVRLWRSDDYTCGAVYFGHNYPIWCFAESSSRNVFATGSRDLMGKVWCIERKVPLVMCAGHSKDIHTVDFHPNGAYFATGSSDTTIRMWNTPTGELVRVFINRAPVYCIKFSPNGKYLAASGQDRKVTIYELVSGKEYHKLLGNSSEATNIIWHPSGNGLATCCSDGSIRVFDFNLATKNSENRKIKYFSGCRRNIELFYNSNGSLSVAGN